VHEVTRGGWRVLALPLVTLLGFGLSVALDAKAPASGPGVEISHGEAGWPYALLGVSLAVCATVVLLRQRRQLFGWTLAGLGAFWMVDGLSQSYVSYAIHPHDALPLSTLALWVLNRLGAFLPFTAAALLMLFPTGRVLPGRWGTASRVALVLMAAAAGAVLLVPHSAESIGVELPPDVDPNAGTIPWLESSSHAGSGAAIATSLLGVVVAMGSVVVRYRRSTGVDRDRMRWLLWSVMAMALLLGLSVLVDAGSLRGVCLFLVVLLPPVAMTVAVVDPDLVPVEDLLSRTLLYGALSLVLVGVDLGILTLLTKVLGDSLDQRDVVLTVLLLTALLYGPLRLRLRTAVSRVMLGRRAARYDVVAGLASTLENADDGAEQLAAVARAVGEAFGVRYVGVEIERPSGEHLVASYGDRPASTRTLPITYRETPIGRLVLPDRGLRSRLSRRDEELLGDLVRQAATAARASQLAEELQRGRERMVLAREEERRRIRRDLHDGLGPALSGVVFRLESARLLVDSDPDAAKGHLQATTEDVKEVVADVRRLVHDLRPPALDDRGLVGALSQLAERQAVPTSIEAEGIGALPAAVEVAAYRIAAEALTNVSRHSGASRCLVRLVGGSRELMVEVADDGNGIPEQAQVGVGLLSLRERAEELGGRSEVTCPDGGGTVVRAWLPLLEAVS
jgi:signal transduction histidine kinase